MIVSRGHEFKPGDIISLTSKPHSYCKVKDVFVVKEVRRTTEWICSMVEGGADNRILALIGIDGVIQHQYYTRIFDTYSVDIEETSK